MPGAMSARLVRENRSGGAKKVDHGRLLRLTASSACAAGDRPVAVIVGP